MSFQTMACRKSLKCSGDINLADSIYCRDCVVCTRYLQAGGRSNRSSGCVDPPARSLGHVSEPPLDSNKKLDVPDPKLPALCTDLPKEFSLKSGSSAVSMARLW